jgi:ABC-type multidrug transport system ATPase subunit
MSAKAADTSRRVLFVDSVSKSFGERRVLSNASAWAWTGRISALLGRNGCGKSTLLKIAAGQLKPDYGSVELLGEKSYRPRLHRLAKRGLFYLPERGLLSWTHTVGEHLELFARRFGSDAGRIGDRLDLRPLIDSLPQNLSTGERRRAEIALALIRAPGCLLADEPLLGIAPRDVDLIGGGLRDLASNGCGVLVTGHEVLPLLALADDVIWMTAGTTHALGSPAKASAHDQFRREYLGTSPPILAGG